MQTHASHLDVIRPVDSLLASCFVHGRKSALANQPAKFRPRRCHTNTNITLRCETPQGFCRRGTIATPSTVVEASNFAQPVIGSWSRV